MCGKPGHISRNYGTPNVINNIPRIAGAPSQIVPRNEGPPAQSKAKTFNYMSMKDAVPSSDVVAWKYLEPVAGSYEKKSTKSEARSGIFQKVCRRPPGNCRRPSGEQAPAWDWRRPPGFGFSDSGFSNLSSIGLLQLLFLVDSYINDIPVYSKIELEHMDYLRMVLEILRQQKLYAKFSQCEFWLREVQFLGHVMSNEGVKVDLSKIEAVINWERPKTPTEQTEAHGLSEITEMWKPNFRNIRKSSRSTLVQRGNSQQST
ncbi:hypothetical protein AgCh_012117 [Apium graveolens]